jgi:RimJ/RimL family protein N-acetyltransferase
VVDRATEAGIGQASYLRIEPEHGVIEIGHIALGPALQRTPGATEAIFLLARHAFDDLGYRRLEWKCEARTRVPGAPPSGLASRSRVSSAST